MAPYAGGVKSIHFTTSISSNNVTMAEQRQKVDITATAENNWCPAFIAGATYGGQMQQHRQQNKQQSSLPACTCITQAHAGRPTPEGDRVGPASRAVGVRSVSMKRAKAVSFAWTHKRFMIASTELFKASAVCEMCTAAVADVIGIPWVVNYDDVVVVTCSHHATSILRDVVGALITHDVDVDLPVRGGGDTVKIRAGTSVFGSDPVSTRPKNFVNSHVIDVAGDGNCFYSCVGMFFGVAQQEVRRWTSQAWDTWGGIRQFTEGLLAADETRGTTVAERKKEVLENGRWAEDADITLLAIYLNVTFEIAQDMHLGSFVTTNYITKHGGRVGSDLTICLENTDNRHFRLFWKTCQLKQSDQRAHRRSIRPIIDNKAHYVVDNEEPLIVCSRLINEYGARSLEPEVAIAASHVETVRHRFACMQGGSEISGFLDGRVPLDYHYVTHLVETAEHQNSRGYPIFDKDECLTPLGVLNQLYDFELYDRTTPDKPVALVLRPGGAEDDESAYWACNPRLLPSNVYTLLTKVRVPNVIALRKGKLKERLLSAEQIMSYFEKHPEVETKVVDRPPVSASVEEPPSPATVEQCPVGLSISPVASIRKSYDKVKEVTSTLRDSAPYRIGMTVADWLPFFVFGGALLGLDIVDYIPFVGVALWLARSARMMKRLVVLLYLPYTLYVKYKRSNANVKYPDMINDQLVKLKWYTVDKQNSSLLSMAKSLFGIMTYTRNVIYQIPGSIMDGDQDHNDRKVGKNEKGANIIRVRFMQMQGKEYRFTRYITYLNPWRFILNAVGYKDRSATNKPLDMYVSWTLIEDAREKCAIGLTHTEYVERVGRRIRAMAGALGTGVSALRHGENIITNTIHVANMLYQHDNYTNRALLVDFQQGLATDISVAIERSKQTFLTYLKSSLVYGSIIAMSLLISALLVTLLPLISDAQQRVWPFLSQIFQIQLAHSLELPSASECSLRV